MDSTTKVIQLSGILDSIAGKHLRQEVTDLVDAGVPTILLNCQEVTFMDSSGLSALVMVLKKVREAGGDLLLCSINHQVRLLLELTGMDGVFEILAS
ncbi:STAS domain-containing protein [Phormidium tenue FACHB-886]|nr:STAS domain-containing protein [Phormidium tenue FACHB-886]